VDKEAGIVARLARISRAVFLEVCSMLYVPSWFARVRRFPADDLSGAREFLGDHGWVIVRGVFSPQDIADLRDRVQRAADEGFAGDVITNRHLGDDRFVLDDRLLAVVRALLPGRPVLFGDCSMSVGLQTSLAFHKDNPDRRDQSAPDWSSPYTILRFGLYLQDHSKHSGGLALRDRSHLRADATTGRPFSVPTEVGDVVAWTLRTTHSGFTTRLRGLRNAFVPLTLMSLIVGSREYSPPAWLFRPVATVPRMALFATFGVDDSHLRRFISYLKTREYSIQH
jgi:hypothetical protein